MSAGDTGGGARPGESAGETANAPPAAGRQGVSMPMRPAVTAGGGFSG